MKRPIFNLNQPAGFTLIETIIALTMAILIIGIVTSVYLVSRNIYRRADLRSEIAQNGRVMLDRISRELRQTPAIVTTLPTANSNPEILPTEIIFQDGHDISAIKYIRYYLENSDLKRQGIAYTFSADPETYVDWRAVDENGNPPQANILEDKLIGEYLSDLEFWGNGLVNINLYLVKQGQTLILNTAIYGRNL